MSTIHTYFICISPPLNAQTIHDFQTVNDGININLNSMRSIDQQLTHTHTHTYMGACMGHVRNITYTHRYARWLGKILRIRTVVKQIKEENKSGKKTKE